MSKERITVTTVLSEDAGEGEAVAKAKMKKREDVPKQLGR